MYFIVYELDTWSPDLNSAFTLRDCFFGGIKIAQNTDRHEYVYSGYGTGFDLHSEFHYLTVTWVKISLFLELIWDHLCILIIKYLNSWYRFNTRTR